MSYTIAYVHTKSHSKRAILLTKGMAYINMYVCTCMCISILVIHMHNGCVFTCVLVCVLVTYIATCYT